MPCELRATDSANAEATTARGASYESSQEVHASLNSPVIDVAANGRHAMVRAVPYVLLIVSDPRFADLVAGMIGALLAQVICMVQQLKPIRIFMFGSSNALYITHRSPRELNIQVSNRPSRWLPSTDIPSNAQYLTRAISSNDNICNIWYHVYRLPLKFHLTISNLLYLAGMQW